MLITTHSWADRMLDIWEMGKNKWKPEWRKYVHGKLKYSERETRNCQNWLSWGNDENNANHEKNNQKVIKQKQSTYVVSKWSNKTSGPQQRGNVGPLRDVAMGTLTNSCNVIGDGCYYVILSHYVRTRNNESFSYWPKKGDRRHHVY